MFIVKNDINGPYLQLEYLYLDSSRNSIYLIKEIQVILIKN